jgi:hypothetical protein
MVISSYFTISCLKVGKVQFYQSSYVRPSVALVMLVKTNFSDFYIINSAGSGDTRTI